MFHCLSKLLLLNLRLVYEVKKPVLDCKEWLSIQALHIDLEIQGCQMCWERWVLTILWL